LPDNLAGQAHLVLVENPAHHPHGDFSLQHGRVKNLPGRRYTYSGIAVYIPEFFQHCDDTVFPLAPLLNAAIARQQVSGELYTGAWRDIGTPERLALLDKSLSSK